MQEKADVTPKTFLYRFDRFLRKHIEPKVEPFLSWLFWKCLKDERQKNRFLSGIREFCWCVMCGWGIRSSLYTANIWWKIGK